MVDTTTLPFDEEVSLRMHAAHEQLAADWLSRLDALTTESPRAIFPGASLLDHIPGLICHIADHLRSDGETAIVADTAVTTKAQELGELRFAQDASVHQLLREYELLADVLNAFVGAEVDRLGGSVKAADALSVSALIREAVFVLMQTTVDTFVARYAERVAHQTARLEGFNRMVSHELRQPLGAIRSAIELLRHDGADLPPEAGPRCLEVIDRNSRRMATLTDTLLTISSLEVESIQEQELDLSQLVDRVCEQLVQVAEHHGVSVRSHVPGLTIRSDAARLELIVVNLLSNAIKYCDPDKSERVVEVTLAEEPDRIRLSVRDNGLGIPATEHDHVFEGFVRAHAARDRELGADGVGLGLSIVADCARHINATVTFDSKDGHGTTFHVVLPTPRRDADAASPDSN